MDDENSSSYRSTLGWGWVAWRNPAKTKGHKGEIGLFIDEVSFWGPFGGDRL